MDVETLRQLARYQAWADAEHWRVLRDNAQLPEDAEIRERLKHIIQANDRLQRRARGEEVGEPMKVEPSELESAMTKADADLIALLDSLNLEAPVSLPRGPKGPYSAPVWALLLQAVTHGQHHRGQNATRMRALGVTPPFTDFIYWYGLGQPLGRRWATGIDSAVPY
jgi:uncharacterized damage-inducible protein DinB